MYSEANYDLKTNHGVLTSYDYTTHCKIILPKIKKIFGNLKRVMRGFNNRTT